MTPLELCYTAEVGLAGLKNCSSFIAAATASVTDLYHLDQKLEEKFFDLDDIHAASPQLLVHQLRALIVARLRQAQKQAAPPKEIQSEMATTLQTKVESTRDNARAMVPPWQELCQLMRRDVNKEDLSKFMLWDTVTRIPLFVVSQEPWILAMFQGFSASPDFEERWKPMLLQESEVGTPVMKMSQDLPVSVTALYTASHLRHFEEIAGVDINDMDIIFEFGGTYGMACWEIHALGFEGLYINLDIPAFGPLFEYYTRATGLLVYDGSKQSTAIPSGVVSTTSIDYVRALIEEKQARNPLFGQRSLFLSLWGVAETPKETLDAVIDIVAPFGYHFLAHHKLHKFVGEAFQEGTDADFWDTRPSPYRPEQLYVVGARSAGGEE